MSQQLQTLEPEVVCQVTEALMLTHGTTTTLEVKNELREQGFFAVQAEVSALMEVIAEERHWKFWHNGRHRIYTFAEDTDERLYRCLAKGDQTWEIMVEGNMQIIAEGRPGRSLPISCQEFPSNRHALAHASGLVMIQESKGFKAAVPGGVNLQHRFRFRELILQKPLSCVLSFREGVEKAAYPAQFLLHGQTATGRLVVEKKVGYAFELSAAEAKTALSQQLHDKGWKVADDLRQKGLLLGEGSRRESAFLASGEALGQWTLIRQAAAPSEVELDLPASGIYKAELRYENDRVLELSYQQWAPDTELWPLVLLLLGL